MNRNDHSGPENYELILGYSKMNFHHVQRLLGETYWVKDISYEEVLKSAQNSSLTLGFKLGSEQVAYGRVISDKTRFGYICDVIVHPDHRKKGLGKRMIKAILENQDHRDVYQWYLITNDAHEVYRAVGFQDLKNPEKWMEIRNPRPKR